MSENHGTDFGRRGFVVGTGAAVLGAGVARGQGAGGKVRLGIIGCGGRGEWLAGLFAENGGFQVVSVADYFADRVAPTGDKHGVDAKRRFTGLSCYQKMIEAGGLDAVAIVSPPLFHPEQAKAAVDAGLHVWLAKPAAVDVAGCKVIEAAAAKATKQGTCFLVDFQTRATEFFQEAVKRVHDGAIGEMAFGESTYHAGRLAVKSTEATQEGRLRNWVFDQALSGDIITEQNIHTLDVMSWIMNKPPVSVSGTGGRTVRVDAGDCWDHFTLAYDYGGGVGVAFSSRQFDGHGSSPSGILNRMFGTEGVIETAYGGNVMVRGKNFYRGGKTNAIYKDGVNVNIATFREDIAKGRATNLTVAPSLESNLVTIMGRTAAYERRTVTWEETVKDASETDGKLGGLQA